MGKYKTSEAQRRAVKRYKKRNPERTRITRYRTNARTFARHYATKEDMENLMEVFKKENKNYKKEK